MKGSSMPTNKPRRRRAMLACVCLCARGVSFSFLYHAPFPYPSALWMETAINLFRKEETSCQEKPRGFPRLTWIRPTWLLLPVSDWNRCFDFIRGIFGQYRYCMTFLIQTIKYSLYKREVMLKMKINIYIYIYEVGIIDCSSISAESD